MLRLRERSCLLRNVLTLGLGWLLLPWSWPSPAQAESAAQSCAPVVLESYPQQGGPEVGSRAGEPIRISLRGAIDPAGAEIWSGDGLRSPGQSLVIGYLRALAHGTVEEIATFWETSKRDEIAERLSGSALGKARAFHRGVASVWFYGELCLGAHRVFFFRVSAKQGTLSRFYPTKLEEGIPRLSEAPLADPDTVEILGVLSEGLSSGAFTLAGGKKQ